MHGYSTSLPLKKLTKGGTILLAFYIHKIVAQTKQLWFWMGWFESDPNYKKINQMLFGWVGLSCWSSWLELVITRNLLHLEFFTWAMIHLFELFALWRKLRTKARNYTKLLVSVCMGSILKHPQLTSSSSLYTRICLITHQKLVISLHLFYLVSYRNRL